jgi:hypothetical protein
MPSPRVVKLATLIGFSLVMACSSRVELAQIDPVAGAAGVAAGSGGAAMGTGGVGGAAGAGGQPPVPVGDPLGLVDEIVLPGQQARVAIADSGRALVATGAEGGIHAILWAPELLNEPDAPLVWHRIIQLDPPYDGPPDFLTSTGRPRRVLQDVALGDSGDAWVLCSRWLGDPTSPSGGELYLHHLPASATSDVDWQTEVVAPTGIGRLSDPIQPQAKMALSSSGHLTVAWAEDDGPIAARVRTPAGAWSAVEEIDSMQDWGALLEIAAAPDGTPRVAISHAAFVPEYSSELRIVQREASGWAVVAEITPFPNGATARTSEGDLWLASSKVSGSVTSFKYGQGSGFEESTNVPNDPSSGSIPYALAADTDGNATFAFSRNDTVVLDGPAQGLSLSEHASGSGWTAQQELVFLDDAIDGVAVDRRAGVGSVVAWSTDGGVLSLRNGATVPELWDISGYIGPLRLAPDGRALLMSQQYGLGQLTASWLE